MKIFYIMTIFGFAMMEDSVAGVKVEMTLYANQYNQRTGQSITVDQTHRDFQCVTNILGMGEGLKSLCYVGAWGTFDGPRGIIWPHGTTRQCQTNYASSVNITNVYRLGPPDTAIPAITFFNYIEDEITVIEKNAEAYVNITSEQIVFYTFIFTSGWSNWTLYELNNFNGQATCLTSAGEIDFYTAKDLGFPTIGSVIKGCNLKHGINKIKSFNDTVFVKSKNHFLATAA